MHACEVMTNDSHPCEVMMSKLAKMWNSKMCSPKTNNTEVLHVNNIECWSPNTVKNGSQIIQSTTEAYAVVNNSPKGCKAGHVLN